MNEAEHMQRVEALFHRVRELPPAQRGVAAAEWSSGDQALAREVLELIAADEAVGEAMVSAPPVARELSEEAWEGRMVGAYRLLEMLGRGGMGVVYLAETLSGAEENAKEKVAIKFLRRSLRGDADSPAVRHFLLERDALAGLQHPNIARLLDAGVAGGLSGHEAVPYVVMELIAGKRLDEVADSTDAHGVVRLMLQLCEAVSFVHRNLVLHRDLKPGNVLVNEEGVVKLLDFGTLKLLGPEEGQSAMTQAGMRPMTLRYSAPEHVLSGSMAAACGAAVTTATDVYSLGMVLYRLLAGALPQELEQGDVLGWFDRLKAGGVAPPSRVARRALPGDLAGDLDAITLKALRYEPKERYPSAQALGDDLRRVLAEQPVTAREGSTRYRVRKWYGRNRGLFWAGTAAAMVLLAGLLAMRHETKAALAQERTAQTGFEQERVLAHTLLFDYFDQLRTLPGSTNAQKRTVTEALAYLNGLSATSGGQRRSGLAEPTRELEMDQVQGYTSMGSVLGSPYEENLGQPDAALVVLKKGVGLAQALADRYPNDGDVLRAQANASQALANVYIGQAQMKDALVAVTEATHASERLVAQPAAKPTDFSVAAASHDAMGDLLNGRDGSAAFDPAHAAQLYQRAADYDRHALTLDPQYFRARRGLAVEWYKLGLLEENTDPIASTAWQEKALSWLKAFSPADRAKPAVSRLYYAIESHVGLLDAATGKTAEGVALLSDVLTQYHAVYAADPINDQALFDCVNVEANIGEAYELGGARDPAAAEYRQSADDLGKLLQHDPKNMNWGYRAALMRYRQASVGGGGSPQQAAVAMEQFAHRPDFNTPDLPDVLEAMNASGADPQGAAELARRLVRAAPDLGSDGLTVSAKALQNAGARGEAKDLARRALEKLRSENVSTARQREDTAVDVAILREP